MGPTLAISLTAVFHHITTTTATTAAVFSAYIETSIWGTNFCTSAWSVFTLLQKHLSLIAIVNGVA